MTPVTAGLLLVMLLAGIGLGWWWRGLVLLPELHRVQRALQCEQQVLRGLHAYIDAWSQHVAETSAPLSRPPEPRVAHATGWEDAT